MISKNDFNLIEHLITETNRPPKLNITNFERGNLNNSRSVKVRRNIFLAVDRYFNLFVTDYFIVEVYLNSNIFLIL